MARSSTNLRGCDGCVIEVRKGGGDKRTVCGGRRGKGSRPARTKPNPGHGTRLPILSGSATCVCNLETLLAGSKKVREKKILIFPPLVSTKPPVVDLHCWSGASTVQTVYEIIKFLFFLF